MKLIGKPLLRIFLIGILAIVANCAALVFNFRWDVTAAQSHTLSSETKNFLAHLPKPIQMTVFYSGAAPRYLKDLLERYQQSSDGKITTEIIDPLVNLTYAARFGTTIDKSDTKVFLQSGDKTIDVNFTGEALTQDLLNFGILRLNRPVKLACFTAGHGEYKLDSDNPEGLKKLKKRLADQNIQSRELVLGMKPQVPDICDVVIIPGPHTAFPAEEEKAVLDYLHRGGDALVLIENTVITTPDAPLTKEQEDMNPPLDGILNPWGLKAGKDIVVDLSSHISGDPGTPATRNYMKHPSLIKDLDYTFYVRPRSLSTLMGRVKDIKLAPFVMSASEKSSWAETNRMLEVKFDDGIDKAGPVAISYVAWSPRPNEKASDTRMIVFTDADFLSNAFIDQFSNGQMAVNIINWLVDVDFQTDLSSKSAKTDIARLDLTSSQKLIVAWVLIAMPAVLLMCGVIIWGRRR